MAESAPDFGTAGVVGGSLLGEDRTERSMTKTRRKIEAGLKAKIALEALGEQTTANDLARGREPAGQNQRQTEPLAA